MSLGILCPGQGSQHAGMLDLVWGRPEAEAVLRLAETVMGESAPDLLAGPRARLFENPIAQPLICATEIAIWAALAPHLPQPRVFAGYSVGELAAYGCAGALEPKEVIAIARGRAKAMREACSEPCRMIAVRDLPVREVELLAGKCNVEVAIVNAEDRSVVGGIKPAVDAFEAMLRAMGAGVTALAVNVASHTRLMAGAVDSVRSLLEASNLTRIPAPVLAGIDGMPVLTPARAIHALSVQTAQTVRWGACLEGLQETGCTVLLELGPGSDLARMARDQLPEIAVHSIADFRTLDGAIAWVLQRL